MTTPVFKCEDSLWRMLKSGKRTFDMRLDDPGDDRINSLTLGHWEKYKFKPNASEVTFLNKATGETVTFENMGAKYTDWAPGWCFLILGKEVKNVDPT